jgi:predicted AlkP superfamily phosphohydrolase/phosphomutase
VYKKRKLVIIGIDGGTFKILDPLIEKGKLPNLERIIKSGVRGILKSTYPPVTAAAWVSFMTGKNPGKHGFFDFREYDPQEYIPTYVPVEKHAVGEKAANLHSSLFRGETIWDFLSKAGYEMSLVAVPMTYPPWEINGWMVPGFPCPDYIEPKTYPPEWSREIGRLFNMALINYSNPDKCIKECKDLVKREGRIILNQIKGKRGEVFCVVFSSPDFAQHFFWKFLEQGGNPYTAVIEEIYEEMDKVLGEILNLLDEDTSFIIMSDHGFMGHPKKYFNLNSWLLQERYISLRHNKNPLINIPSKIFEAFISRVVYKKAKLKIDIKEKITKMPLFLQKWSAKHYFKTNLTDWDNTKAFRFKMYGNVEGIVINLKDRQKNGIVENGEEYEKLRDEIISKLILLNDPDTGEKIVAEACRREEIYRGGFLKRAPDIIITFAPSYIGGNEIKGSVISPVSSETREMFSGIHERDGIFIFSGPNVRKGERINPVDIVDVVPTILYDAGLPIPEDIDGRIIEEAFLDSFKTNLNSGTFNGRISQKTDESLSPEDEKAIRGVLKGLGYLN